MSGKRLTIMAVAILIVVAIFYRSSEEERERCAKVGGDWVEFYGSAHLSPRFSAPNQWSFCSTTSSNSRCAIE